MNMFEFDSELDVFHSTKIVGVGQSGILVLNRFLESELKEERLKACCDVSCIGIVTNMICDSKHFPLVSCWFEVGLDAGYRLAAFYGAKAEMVIIIAGKEATDLQAAIVAAQCAEKLQDALTLAFVVKSSAERQDLKQLIAELRSFVDGLIVIDENYLRLANDDTEQMEVREELVAEKLFLAVQGVLDSITPGLIGFDYQDLKMFFLTSFSNEVRLGVGIGKGDDRATVAAKQALKRLKLECTVAEAEGVFISMRASEDVELVEINEAAILIAETSPKSEIIFTAVVDKEMQDCFQVAIFVRGLRGNVTSLD